MWTIQFIIRCDGGSALCWPTALHGIRSLTHEPADAFRFYSELDALEDVSGWCRDYAAIQSAEVIPFGGCHDDAA